MVDSFFLQLFHKHVWFSGIIAACHAVDPGSIPGTCKFVAGVAQWIAHLASDQKAAGSSPAVRALFCNFF